MFQCYECPFETKDIEILRRHDKENHVIGQLFNIDKFKIEKKVSPKCKSKSNCVTKSMENKSTNLKFHCNDCQFSSNYKHSLKFHIDNVHLNILKYSCSNCDFKAFRKKAVLHHINKSHVDEKCHILKIGCKACEERGSEESHYKGHGRNRKFKCQENGCDFTSNKKLRLRNHHEHKHLKILRFSCNLCSMKTYYKHTLKSHHIIQHPNESPQFVTIGREGKMNMKKEIIKIKNHGNPKPFKDKRKEKSKIGIFKCPDCDFTTDTKQGIKTHSEVIHLRILRFSCSLCIYQSYYSSHVRIHLVKHKTQTAKILKIGCILCEKGTDHVNHSENQKDYLTIENKSKIASNYCEEETQHNEKPNDRRSNLNNFSSKKYKCLEGDCNFSSNNKQSLTSHNEGVHLNILRYYCNICDYKDYFKHVVENHQKKNHKEEGNLKAKILIIGCSMCENNSEHKIHTALRKCRKTAKTDNISCEKGTDQIPKQRSNQNNFSPKKYKCLEDDCNFSSNHKQSLTFHTEGVHLNILRYYCNICDYKDYFKHVVENHQKKYHRECLVKLKILRIGCSMCENNLKHKRHTASEGCEKTSVKDDTLLCKDCDHEPFINNSKRIQHYKTEHPGKSIFNCKICKYGTNYFPNLRTHNDSKHEKKDIKCPQCPFTTTWNPLFHKHMRTEHKVFQKKSKFYKMTKSKYYVMLCDECGYKTYELVEFENHTEVCTGIFEDSKDLRKIYKCDFPCHVFSVFLYLLFQKDIHSTETF